MQVIVYLAICFLQIVITFPNFIRTCRALTVKSFTLYFVHHFLDVFLFWSFLFLTTPPEFLAHAILIVIIAIHWLTYDNKCIITVWMNQGCGWPDAQWLDSFKNRLGLRDVHEYFHFIWIGLLFLYDLYFLYF